MKQKEWKDCPVCGKKGSMKLKKRLFDVVELKGYEPIRVGPLEAFICNNCGDGFNTIKSSRMRKAQIAEGRARQDSERTVVTDVIDINTLAGKLSVSRQRIRQMMEEGKIPYVFVSGIKYPVKSDVEAIATKMKRVAKKKRSVSAT